MRIVTALAIFVCAIPAVAQSPQASESVFQAALRNIPDMLQGVQHSFPNSNFAIADRATGGAKKRLREFADKFFSPSIAEELIQSYDENSAVPRSIAAGNDFGIPVLAVERFSSGGTTYDWGRLNVSYPNVHSVVRVSFPAVDRQSTYAVVRYEVISSSGPEWTVFEKFEKQANGSWKAAIASADSLR